MSVNIKVKHLVLFAFIFGCATGPAIQKYLSFQDAVAKTGSKCQYLMTPQGVIRASVNSEGISLIPTPESKQLMKHKWKAISIGGSDSAGDTKILWKKCTR